MCTSLFSACSRKQKKGVFGIAFTWLKNSVMRYLDGETHLHDAARQRDDSLREALLQIYLIVRPKMQPETQDCIDEIKGVSIFIFSCGER